jgi:uncharacterized protein YegP (UPF0339 family)
MSSGVYTVHIFRDVGKKWRWNVTEANGDIVATSGQGYEKKQHAIDMVSNLFHALPVVSSDAEE